MGPLLTSSPAALRMTIVGSSWAYSGISTNFPSMTYLMVPFFWVVSHKPVTGV